MIYGADADDDWTDEAVWRKANPSLGVTVPIVPGIMPISNYAQLRRFSESCGAEIPRWIDQRMRAHGDDVDAVREFAADLVVSLCWRLIKGGAPALHFFTLNLSRPTLMVLSRL